MNGKFLTNCFLERFYNYNNKYNFSNQKNNNIFDKLSFYKITNLFIKKYGFDEYKKIYNKILNHNIVKYSINYKITHLYDFLVYSLLLCTYHIDFTP